MTKLDSRFAAVVVFLSAFAVHINSVTALEGVNVSAALHLKFNPADTHLIVTFRSPEQSSDMLLLTTFKLTANVEFIAFDADEIESSEFVYGWFSTPPPSDGIWVGKILRKGETTATINLSLDKVLKSKRSGNILLTLDESDMDVYVDGGTRIMFAPVSFVDFKSEGGITLRPGYNAPVFGNPTHWQWSNKSRPRPVSIYLEFRLQSIAEAYMERLTALTVGLTILGGPLWLAFGQARRRVPEERKKYIDGARVIIGIVVLFVSAGAHWYGYFSINTMLLGVGMAVILLGLHKLVVRLVARSLEIMVSILGRGTSGKTNNE